MLRWTRSFCAVRAEDTKGEQQSSDGREKIRKLVVRDSPAGKNANKETEDIGEDIAERRGLPYAICALATAM
jgi:hypothetical protein